MKNFRYLLALIACQVSFAQTAAIRGQIIDQSGGVVPAAKVDLTSSAGVVRSTVADGVGSYSFSGLLPAAYTLSASASNLVQQSPVKITVKNSLQVVDLHLAIAEIVERVTVQENAGPSVGTAAAENASALVLKGTDLDALSDDPDDLQSDLQALAGPSAGPSGGSMYIDGFSGGELPPKSSIREIRINQNPFSPEYDKLGYGRIDILTKPGSDRFRGTFNYNIGSQVLNSRNPYSAEKAPFLLNEFEGDGGGPLGKKASFILEAQRNLVDNGSIANAVVVDPSLLGVSRVSSIVTTPQRLTRVSPRVDYQLNENNTLTMRYGVTHADIREAGIGALDLASRGYYTQYTNQTVQASETAVHGATINETRFQYFRMAIQMIANDASPALQVLGSFNGGGSPLGQSFDRQDSFELQNYTSMLKGAHSYKFGIRLRAQTDANVSPVNFSGTFTFAGGGLAPVLNQANQAVLDAAGNTLLAPVTSVERYRRTLLFQQLNYPAPQIRELGGGATQFSINAGAPALTVHQFDAGLFAGDEWRFRPNLTLNAGVRYEGQTNVHDWRDFAPRIAFAWAPGSAAHGSRPKTIIRAGFGMFYDRFSLANTLAAQRYNGSVQKQYVVANPDFFPAIPATGALSAYASTQVTQEVDAQLRTPYIMQSVLTLERQLPANTTMAVTYTNSHGVHEFRSRDINAPLPGTFDPAVQGSGTFPLGNSNPLFLTESSGIYNQNQVIANASSRFSSAVSLFGFYVFNRAKSNTDGVGTSPANPYNFSGEYGPALTDVRHRASFGGSLSLRWHIRISPFLLLQTGVPFNITSGNDTFGTTLFNARPGIASDPGKAGLVQTSYGLLDPNPSANERIISRNYGRGPTQISFNMRLAKTIGFGPERGGGAAKRQASPGGGGINPIAAAGGRGMGGILGAPSTSHRYNLTLALSARNVLNHVNPGPIIGNITSPLFGQANQVAGTPNGEGFFETANNRRLEWQIRFAF
jgi:hypothetical protein